MNRKFEDKLVRLAFGDVSPKESSSLERKVQSDPEAARTLEEYRSLKLGLNLLTEVPPDQLSKERLQNAILGQGLKPLPAETPTRWGWVWLPTAAFALAFGWLTLRHGPAPGPRIVQNAPMTAFRIRLKSELTPPATKLVARVEKPVHEDLPEHLVVRRHPAESAPEPTLTERKLTPEPKAVHLATNPAPKAAQTSTMVAADTSDSGGKLVSINGPLVVINPENDNNSGAQKATEVDGASDVGPVGG